MPWTARSFTDPSPRRTRWTGRNWTACSPETGESQYRPRVRTAQRQYGRGSVPAAQVWLAAARARGRRRAALEVHMPIVPVRQLPEVIPGLGQHITQDPLDFVELLGPAHQRWRKLDHRVTPVIRAADQAGV